MNLITNDTFFFFCITILIITTLVLFRIARLMKEKQFQRPGNDELENAKENITLYKNIFLYSSITLILFYAGYKEVVKTGLEAHAMEWLNLVVRWAHVVLGISWIGASFYFIFLENSLNRAENLRDELAGNLWAIHGGGFYYIEKYKIAPGEIPKKLHWFKYEAYFTWVTGIILLVLVYYMNANAFMTDPSVSNISSLTAVCIGIGTMIFGWLMYDLLCRTSLLHNKALFALVGFIIVTAISVFLSKMLSGRASFMHVGALLGTIMAGNVFFTIIPSQKALIKAAKEKMPLDPKLGNYAGLRSLHNNYITFPVIFIMISNHFPSTFGNKYNWEVLAGLTLASVAVRHFINLYEKGKYAVWIVPFAVIALISLVVITAPVTNKGSAKNSTPVFFSQVQPVFLKRCVQCHSLKPTDEKEKIAPNGVMLDTPEQIKKMSDRIMIRVVQTKTMPQANKTGITEEERELIGRWIEQGGKID